MVAEVKMDLTKYSTSHPGYNQKVKVGDLVVWDTGTTNSYYEDDPTPVAVTKVSGTCFWTERCKDFWTNEGGCYCVIPKPTTDTPSDTLQTFPTGALRESKDGKGRPDLLLAGFPRALKALSQHMDCPLGRERNWEKGLPESSLVASQFRHLTGYASGVSEDTSVYNLTAALWNSMVLLETFLRVQDGVMPESLLDIVKGAPDGEAD